MDEGVDAVDPDHQGRVAHEEFLNVRLDEYVQFLFEVNELQRMFPCDIDCSFHERQRGKRATKLVNLRKIWSEHDFDGVTRPRISRHTTTKLPHFDR